MVRGVVGFSGWHITTVLARAKRVAAYSACSWACQEEF